MSLEAEPQQGRTAPLRVRAAPMFAALALHAAVLVACVLIGWSARREGPAAHSSRPVAVAIARRTAPSAGIQYFKPSHRESAPREPAARHRPGASTALPLALPGKVAPRAPSLLLGEESPAANLGSAAAAPRISTQGRSVGPPKIGEPLPDDDIERVAAPRHAGPPATITPFGRARVTGRSFVFVIDVSQSMGPGGIGALAAAERELKVVLADLEPHHRFQIIAYNQRVQYLNLKGLLPATEANRRRADRFLAGVAPHGGTQHVRGILAALHYRPDAVILLTDAEDPWPNDAQVRTMVERAGGRTAIHCLQFGEGRGRQPREFMQRLARLTGGSDGYVDVGAGG